MTTIADVLQFIEARRADPAQLIGLADKLLDILPSYIQRLAPEAERTLGLPPVQALTAMQISLFDNRQKAGRRRTETDFGIQIECWDDGEAPTRRNRLKGLNLKLWTAKELRWKMKKSRASNLSPAWKASILDLIDAHGDDWIFSPMIEVQPGYQYVPDQFVAVNVATRTARIMTPDRVLEVTAFEDFYAGGKALPAGIVGSARLVTDNEDDWCTATFAECNLT